MSKTSKKRSKQTVNKKLPAIDILFDTILRHPFIFTALACILLLPFGFAQWENIGIEWIVLEAAIWIVASTALIAFGSPGSSKKVNIYLIVSSIVLIVAFSVIVAQNELAATYMFVPVLLGVLQIGVVLFRRGKLTADRLIVLLALLGIVARYCYCLTYDVTTMQHDIGTYDGTHGHLSYIQYWYDNGLKLPAFNVTTRWQFYHPPLHHILMAFGMRIFTFFGMPLPMAHEAIQILPMIYSSLCIAAVWRIAKLIGLDGAGLVVAVSAVCFYPTFIIWSGACNNDILMTLFVLLAMLWTLKWAQKPTLLRILPIALCVGCGMMTKLSAWMVAPAIAMVFLWVFIRNIKTPLRFIGQFAAFGAVCAPLGLWWGVRNLLTFKIPLTYVPDTKMEAMSVAHIPAAQRIFDFSLWQFDFPFEAFTFHGATYSEYNPMIGLLKTSVFDEFYEPWALNWFSTALVILAAVLTVIGVAALIWMVCSKRTGMDLMTRLFFAVIVLTFVISYYSFCFEFPYVCTENIRYCIPVIPILSIATGFLCNRVFRKRT